jgi:hypothetical protein
VEDVWNGRPRGLTHVKFYRRSLRDVCELEGAQFDGFRHVDDWVPQRIVTATGPDPVPQ